VGAWTERAVCSWWRYFLKEKTFPMPKRSGRHPDSELSERSVSILVKLSSPIMLRKSLSVMTTRPTWPLH
jgi:hypothetical protein